MTDIPEIETNQTVQVKVSRLAILAIICAIVAFLFLPYINRHSNPEETGNCNVTMVTFLKIAGYLNLSLLLTSVILGFISFIKIEKSGGRLTGKYFSVGAILLSIFFGAFVVLSMSLFYARCPAFRMVCGTNLSGIGKAMLIYANDYDDKFPRAGGKTTKWGTSVKWDATDRQIAYGLTADGTGGTATISSSLYLLVKYAEVTPKSFLCAGDFGVSEFKAKRNPDLIKLWDFGPQPWKYNSYSYHVPYGKYALTTSSDPGMAVAADRNPFMPSPGWKIKDFKKFDPDGDKSIIRTGNTSTHANEGQNVLYLDSHVSFVSTPFCGINQDNIYTSWNGSDVRKGTPPTLGSQPSSNTDSLLENDPPPQKP
jgi:hypothetical protein